MPRSSPPVPPRPHVALLVQTASDWSRQVLEGVAQYAHERGPWDFFIEPRGLYEQLQLPRGWRGDGVIARVDHPELAKAIRRTKLPAVNVAWMGRHSRSIPQVVSDEEGCGRLAAEHLLERGFENFAYVGPFDRPGYVDRLSREFRRVVAARGGRCHMFALAEGEAAKPRQREVHLGRWLASLPRPVGLLAWSSRSGCEALSACAAAGLAVPDEVAILTAEHDSLMSALAPVPLSALDMVPRQVGYRAAELLDSIMRGDEPPAEPLLLPPMGVVHRRSTDTVAVDDPLVAGAVRYIRDRASQPIQVTDVAEAMDVSRRMLEQRFSSALGRSPATEIRRTRIEQAKRLLSETDLNVPAVAARSGFNHVEVMIRAFRRATGLSPGQFRRQRGATV